MSFEVWAIGGQQIGRGVTPEQAVWDAFFQAHLRDQFHVRSLPPGSVYQLVDASFGRGVRVLVHEEGGRASWIGARPIGPEDGRGSAGLLTAGKVAIWSMPRECPQGAGSGDMLIAATEWKQDASGDYEVAVSGLVRHVPTTRTLDSIGLAILHGVHPERVMLPRTGRVV